MRKVKHECSFCSRKTEHEYHHISVYYPSGWVERGVEIRVSATEKNNRKFIFCDRCNSKLNEVGIDLNLLEKDPFKVLVFNLLQGVQK